MSVHLPICRRRSDGKGQTGAVSANERAWDHGRYGQAGRSEVKRQSERKGQHGGKGQQVGASPRSVGCGWERGRFWIGSLGMNARITSSEHRIYKINVFQIYQITIELLNDRLINPWRSVSDPIDYWVVTRFNIYTLTSLLTKPGVQLLYQLLSAFGFQFIESPSAWTNETEISVCHILTFWHCYLFAGTAAFKSFHSPSPTFTRNRPYHPPSHSARLCSRSGVCGGCGKPHEPPPRPPRSRATSRSARSWLRRAQ